MRITVLFLKYFIKIISNIFYQIETSHSDKNFPLIRQHALTQVGWVAAALWLQQTTYIEYLIIMTFEGSKNYRNEFETLRNESLFNIFRIKKEENIWIFVLSVIIIWFFIMQILLLWVWRISLIILVVMSGSILIWMFSSSLFKIK